MNAKNSNGTNSKSFLHAKSVYVLPLLFVLLFIFILALTAMCTTASAVECGCPSETKYHDTIHGGVYFKFYWVWPGEQIGGSKHYKASATFYDIPDKEKIKVARLYTGIWGGSPSKGGKFNITFNGNLSTDYTACDPCPGGPCDDYEGVTGNGTRCNTVNETECRAYTTGCNVMFITYDVLNDIVTGTNTATTESDLDPACSGVCKDNRIYHLALVVVYEDPSMPEITYWIKEGSPTLINGSACSGPGDELYIYFNGSAYPGSVSDMKYWIAGVPGLPDVDAELNGNPIAACDFEDSSYCKRWDNIPMSYLNPSSNLFYYYHPNGGYDRVNVGVLMLNSSGPANLTVTDISPQSMYADPDETGRYANVINATVLNYGKTAYFFNLTLYVDGTKVDVKKVENLGEGESRVVSFLWAPNATASYELNVTADVENVVRETDETNNSEIKNVIVTAAPLPAWQSPSSSASEIPNGGTIELRAQGKAGTGLYNAILATDETGTWMNCTGYGSPLDMTSCYNYSFTHTTDADWNSQTIERQPGFFGKPLLGVGGGDVKLASITSGTENLALNKPAYASSHETGYEHMGYYYYPSYANDGDPGGTTQWASNATLPGTPQWWYVDLEEVMDVTKVVLDFTDYNKHNKYEILTSNDGTKWETQKERNYGADETFENLVWSCRYINVTTYEGFGSQTTRARIQEFEVYGPGNYSSSGTLTSSTIETSSPVVSVIPEWNSTELAGTNLSVNVSVDGGATWKPATNGTELMWDYNMLNDTKLKYRVLFKTTNLSRTPVLHNISLNYTTKDPIESEWLWSNFTWHNDSITCTTVGWKIYYEDMLGQTNCTAVKTFEVGGSWLQTTDADFNAGTKTNISVSGDAFHLKGTEAIANTTVFDDGFEVDISTNWTVSANWAIDSVAHSGTYSAKLGNAEGNLDTKARDCSGAQAIYVDFWYRDHKADAGDFDLQYWNGATWNTITDLAVSTEDMWHNYQQKIIDSQYFISDFKIRFAGSPDGGESIWVDDMKIIKEALVMTGYETSGNLISQTHDTGVAKPSYTDIIVGNSTSGGTAITTEIRAASDQGGLSSAAWHTDIASVPHEQWVQWRVNLTGDGTNTPTVYDVTINWMCGAGTPNVAVEVHNTSFGNMLAGDNNTIYVSLTLNNSEGTAAATIEAVFKTNVSVVYGLNGTFGSNIIPGNYFELGPDGNETALTNSTTKRFISTLDAGAIVDYNAILTVPAGQAADDYSGIVELSW